MEAGLTARAAEAAEALPFLRVVADYDTTAGLIGLDEMLAGSVFQVLEQDGEAVGAYALQLSQHEQGGVLWVVAAGSKSKMDLSQHIHSIIEQQARQVNAAQIALTTVRVGLVRKLLKMGFEVSGITLRKKLCHGTI